MISLPRCLSAVALALCLAPAVADTVVLSDGRKLEGTIRLVGAGIAIELSDGKRETIALTSVLQADFTKPVANVTQAVSSTWLGVDIGARDRDAGEAMAGNSMVVRDGGRWLGHRQDKSQDRSEDSLRFVYRTLKGDGQIVARLCPLSEEPGARVGLMFRKSISPASPFAMVSRTDRYYGQTITRAEEGHGIVFGMRPEYGILGAVWLKLVRDGYHFAAYESADGEDWLPLGTMTVPMAMEETVLAGIAAASGPGGYRLATNRFDHLQIKAVSHAKVAGEWIPKGFVTRTSSTVAANLESADGERLTFVRAGVRRELSASAVAWLVFQPLSRQQQERLYSAAPGVLLLTGDFLEGEFQQLRGDELAMSSVLFGVRKFPIQSGIAGAVLRAVQPAPCAWKVALRDRSLLRALSLTITNGGIAITESSVGTIHVTAAELQQLIQEPKR